MGLNVKKGVNIQIVLNQHIQIHNIENLICRRGKCFLNLSIPIFYNSNTFKRLHKVLRFTFCNILKLLKMVSDLQ